MNPIEELTQEVGLTGSFVGRVGGGTIDRRERDVQAVSSPPAAGKEREPGQYL